MSTARPGPRSGATTARPGAARDGGPRRAPGTGTVSPRLRLRATPGSRARRAALAVLATGAALVLAACGTPAGGQDPVRVLAAASLHGPLDELLALHAERAGGPAPQVTYDGSAALLVQLREGAVADVVVLADAASTARAADDGPLADQGVEIAANTLRIAVAPGNPLAVAGLADLARPDVAVVLCAAPVPCGAATRTLLADAGVDVPRASEEQAVTAVLAKVASGEADAGVVYVTDVLGARGAVDGVEIPGAARARTTVSAAVLDGAPQPDRARDLVALLASPDARAVLARHGFEAP
ncbi:molybdate ABC transporter substrate-binding protein [Cellulomonas sp. NS3]|uniref:molybdate ABC transporter substrate-binding protein n=1 Tax=Cellulomonas sp. NS3 TaxID=2973977 RepID=UPI002162D9A5|nr:molybdate ABC transporter substrate-binding protein [Cellulomonas sp. NS3]